MSGSHLWYLSPATSWTEALPLGNGRLAAMVFGGTVLDRFQINDDRCWSGSPATTRGTPLISPGEGPQVLAEVRAALAEGEIWRAEKTSTRLQHGHSQAFQPLVDLWWEQRGRSSTSGGEVVPRAYARRLDLDTAIASHGFDQDGVRVRQESWISAAHQAMVVTRTADPLDRTGPAVLPRTHISFSSQHPAVVVATPMGADGRARMEVSLRMPSEVVPPHEDLPDPVQYSDETGAAVSAVVIAEILTDGDLAPVSSGVSVTGARQITLVLVTETDYRSPLQVPHGDVEQLTREAGQRLDVISARIAHDDGLQRLRDEHVAEHAALFGRVDLALWPESSESSAEEDGRPTDVRLAAFADGGDDPGLPVLAFQYGRYLMLASSRAGTLPSTLQGVWNDKIRAPWSSNYTTNINLEMNYWPAEVAGLGECHLPLLDWLHAVAVRGAKVAQDLYGMGGWTLHHNSDAWGFALPAGEGDADPCWSFWPLGAAWLCRHVWDHYDFGRDLDRLARDWPVVRSSVEFYLDWLVRGPDGSWATLPSTSPENKFVHDGAAAALTRSSSSDLVLIRDLFERSLDMLDVLDGRVADDVEFRRRVRSVLSALPAERVDAIGRLAEWMTDVEEVDREHRHTSHLVSVYPLARVTPHQDPVLARASLATLDARGPHSTGWALAWRMALRARLRDPIGAETAMRHFLAPLPPDTPEEPSMTAQAGVYRNLFCAHPPFQVDGNFGFTAALAEMLMDSRSNGDHIDLELLPVLTPEWAAGRFSGLRARGGLEIAAQWTGMSTAAAALDVSISPSSSVMVRLRMAQSVLTRSLAPGSLARFSWRAGEGWIDPPQSRGVSEDSRATARSE